VNTSDVGTTRSAPASEDADYEMGLAAHRSGKLDQAAAIYERIVAAHPRHAGSLQHLGVIASQLGQFERAVGLMQRAIALDDRQPAAFVNLGNALMSLGREIEAEGSYRRALTLAPDLPEALFGLGNALRHRDPGEAAASYERAIALRPDFAEALANLAETNLARGHAQEALGQWIKASKLRPAAINLYLGAARTLTALNRLDEAVKIYRTIAETRASTSDELFHAGNSLAELRRFEEAAELYRELLRREPGLFPALNNLGNMLRELGRLDEAEAACAEALALEPRSSAIICNRALILKDLGRIAEAEAECRRSLAIEPTPIGHSNLGVILYSRGMIEEALEEFGAANALGSEMPDIVFHEAIALLHLGRLAEGWLKYEARWDRQRALERRRHFVQPAWQGEPVAGRTILVHAEQGFGDTLQFVRYASLLAERGARVILECQPALARLMAGVEGIAEVIPRGAPLPAFDLHCATLSLPRLFGTVLETIPDRVPYVRPPADAVDQWKAPLAAISGPRIGLVWAGDARHYDIECAMTDRRRSLSLEAYAPLFAIAGLRFVSLQVGPTAAQARNYPELVDLTASIGDFADTAGLIAHLDLVISVDTAVAHLAASMGKPVWVLSRFDNCWRWFTERSDSPWYPTLRLFRQPAPNAWAPVLDRLHAELVQWAAHHTVDG
jgi:tetratricopeptide (TPR) repeat protein